MGIGGYGGGPAGEHRAHDNDNLGVNDGDPYARLLPEPECGTTSWYRDRLGRRAARNSPLPGYRPLTRAELREAGVTRARIRKHFVSPERGLFVHTDQLLPELTDTGYRRSRRIPAVLLVRAHLRRRPRRIATGFAAGRLDGMTHFVEEEPLEFLVPNGADTGNAPPHVRLTRTRNLAAYLRSSVASDAAFPEHRATDPATTLARILMTVAEEDAARDRRWKVPDLTSVRPHLTPEFIRSVQVSDHFHQARRASTVGAPAPLVRAGLPAETAAAVLGATNVGAESPPETLLRLVVADLAPGLQSQVPVFRESGALLTVVDLGWAEHRVFLFYDGAHHLQKEQRDHDSEVFALLQRNGGRVFRVTAGNLKDADKVTELRGWVREALLERGAPCPPG